MPFDRTVTWRQFAHQSIEMRVSVSENLRIWRWIGFLFFRIKKSSGGEGRCSGYSLGSFDALFQFSKSAAGEATKFGRSGVKLLGVVGAARLECGEPAAESGELIRRQLGNSFGDFFDFHGAQLTSSKLLEFEINRRKVASAPPSSDR